MSKPVVVLKDWCLFTFMGEDVLSGRVYGHPYHKDDKAVITSKIIDMNVEDRTVETENTLYKLTTISPAYKVWLGGFQFNKNPFPGALSNE